MMRMQRFTFAKLLQFLQISKGCNSNTVRLLVLKLGKLLSMELFNTENTERCMLHVYRNFARANACSRDHSSIMW